MKFFKYLLAVSSMLVIANPALAAVTYTASATTSDGSPLTAVAPGAQVIIDITVRTDDFASAAGGSVNNYDNSVVALNAGASTIAGTIFNSICVAPGTCFGGLINQSGSAIPFEETTVVAVGVESQFLNALGLAPATGNGSVDEGAVGGVAGDPQFQVVFDVIGVAGTTTTFNIGTYFAYQDGYTGTDGLNPGVSTNDQVTITVPEPAAVATSLAAMSSVFGVIAIRRRML